MSELWALQTALFEAVEEKREALRKQDAEHRKEIERLVCAILDVLDSVDRLRSDESYLASVRLVARRFASAVQADGLDVLGWSGEAADPDTHKVVEVRQVDDVADEVVLQVLRRGYRFRGQVLRPAEVIVAAGQEISDSVTSSVRAPAMDQPSTDEEQG
ncbi:MAG: nucleotide exchange factor GrpE [Pseudonocardiaceae bacterium]